MIWVLNLRQAYIVKPLFKFRGNAEIECDEIVLQLLKLGGADNNGRYRGPVAYPVQRNLCWASSNLLGNFDQFLSDGPITLGEKLAECRMFPNRVQSPFSARIGARTLVSSRQ